MFTLFYLLTSRSTGRSTIEVSCSLSYTRLLYQTHSRSPSKLPYTMGKACSSRFYLSVTVYVASAINVSLTSIISFWFRQHARRHSNLYLSVNATYFRPSSTLVGTYHSSLSPSCFFFICSFYHYHLTYQCHQISYCEDPSWSFLTLEKMVHYHYSTYMIPHRRVCLTPMQRHLRSLSLIPGARCLCRGLGLA